MEQPRYLDPIDRCSQYVCINMGWMLYNLSRNCHKNVEKPDCGFRGMPVQVNSDSCCPEWECPCKFLHGTDVFKCEHLKFMVNKEVLSHFLGSTWWREGPSTMQGLLLAVIYKTEGRFNDQNFILVFREKQMHILKRR